MSAGTPAGSGSGAAQHETAGGAGDSTTGAGRLSVIGNATRVPHQLPAGAARFVNREVEQDALTTLLAGAHPDEALPLSTMDGPAGVGKTALAVRWARRVRDRFPDGDLHVDLRGSDPVAEPVSPLEALGGFLRALGVPADRLPSTMDDRVAMFRGLTRGKRMLLLLDDAAGTQQVLPLLPAGGTCLVLVTSRNRLDELVSEHAATRIGLRLLDERESRELLLGHLGEERLAAEPVAAAELVQHCAGSPLVLGISAGRLAEFDDLALAELVGELRDERDRLGGPDAAGGSAVRAVLASSYRSLSAEAARLFRLLGLPMTPDFALGAVAALAGSTQRAVRGPLGELLRAGLLDQDRDCYRLPGLLRSCAAERAAAEEPRAERDEALRRLRAGGVADGRTGDAEPGTAPV